jgi:ABC-2 type transport system permease protein
VIMAAGVAIALTLLLSAFFNYAYDWKFTSTAAVLLAGLGTIGLIFLVFIDRDWQFNPANNKINALDIYGSVLLFLAALIIAALAVAISCRFNIVVTLSACVGIFLLGLVSDWAFGGLAKTHLWAKICYFVLPNLQIFWISDAIYEGSEVPIRYVLITASYAICYTAGILALAVALFQRRQVG